MKIKISGISKESIVDGKGIRYTIFTQGCPHKCKGCHNPETWDKNKGQWKEIDEIVDEFKKNPLLKGMTFSGGEPFWQSEPLYIIAKEIHKLNKDITVYTGYTYEELLTLDMPYVQELLSETDILIDGKFEEELKNLELLFRGSENQRIIDMNLSRSKGEIVLLDEA